MPPHVHACACGCDLHTLFSMLVYLMQSLLWELCITSFAWQQIQASLAQCLEMQGLHPHLMFHNKGRHDTPASDSRLCSGAGSVIVLASPREHLVRAWQVASAQAGETAAALVQRCVMLARELRGTDLLAERARRLRRDTDKLEALVTRLLLS